MKYRRKIEYIDAVQFNGFVGNGVDVMPVQTSVLGQSKVVIFYIQTDMGKQIVKVGDWIITKENGQRYSLSDEMFCMEFESADSQTNELDDGLNCKRCGQNIAKRKVTFASALTGSLIKAYFYSKEKGVHTVKISDLQLDHSEYNRMNDLVRFGLLYKGEDMGTGEYGVPCKRIADFLNNQWTVAKCYYKNPITKQNEMSQERIYFRDVPSTAELIQQYGEKLTSYVRNDVTQC